MKLSIIQGTTRKGRRSIFVSELFKKTAEKNKEVTSVTLIDPRDFDISEGEQNDNFSKLIKNSDGFILVIPEYNHSFPGSLKSLLDSERDLDNYANKPVLLVGVSVGRFGGTHAVQAILNFVVKICLLPVAPHLLFPQVEKIFDKEGNLTKKDYSKRVVESLGKLLKMAKTLNYGKQNFEL